MTEFHLGQLSGLRMALETIKEFKRGWTTSWREQLIDEIRAKMLGEEPSQQELDRRVIARADHLLKPRAIPPDHCTCDPAPADEDDVTCWCCGAGPGEDCKHGR